MNGVFCALMLAGLLYAAATGRADAAQRALLSGGGEAVALLHAAFRLSAEWNRLDVHPTAARTEDSEGLTYRHIPYEAHGEARMLYAYGILVQKYLQTHGAQGRKQGCPQRGQPCAGKDQAVVFATFSTKRWRMAATCALVALPVGRSLPSEPLTSFSATAQLSGALA